jgi:hypothetical protein
MLLEFGSSEPGYNLGNLPMVGATMSEEDRWRDWATNAAARIKQQRETEVVQNKAFFAKEEIRKRGALRVWEQIRNEMKAMVEALNAHMQTETLAWDNPRTQEAIVRIVDSGRTGKAIFDSESGELQLEGPGIQARYGAVLGPNNEVVFVNPQPQQPHEIAKWFINSLVNLIQ